MAAGAVSLLPTQSQAAPKPTVDEVRKQVEKLYEEAEAPTEEYNEVREEEKKLQDEVDSAQDRLAGKQQEINELRGKIGPLAAAQYRSGAIDPSVHLFLSGDPDDYLDKAEMLGRTSDRQADALRALERKQRELAQERATATQRLKALEQARTKAGEKKDEVQGKLTEARKLLNSLTAEQRARMKAAQERAVTESPWGVRALALRACSRRRTACCREGRSRCSFRCGAHGWPCRFRRTCRCAGCRCTSR
jgi:septal ring factor EnvC (AmiA/AmiB activator)